MLAIESSQSTSPDLANHHKEQFSPRKTHSSSRQFSKQLASKKAVLISPSMSGRYAIPYIFSNMRKETRTLKAWVPVAPVSIRDHTEDEYSKLGVKTFIVYGEKDSSGRAQSLQYLAKIPGSDLYGMINGEHPCYMTDPKEWNQHLLAFLEK